MEKQPTRLTIKDIAKLCGVGKSTVSRVINGDANVKAATRERVERIILQQQFIPSNSARAMRGYRSKAVGIIVSRLDSVAENQAISALLPILYESGFDPIVVESQFDSRKVADYLTLFAQRQIDGVIIFAFTGLDPTLLVEWQNRAVVLARPFPGYHSICYDDQGAVRQIMDYFHQQRHFCQIGYIGVNERDHTTGKLRYQAYCDYCQQQQLVTYARLGELNYDTGYLLAAELLPLPLTAIVCATDTIAIGVNKYLQEKRLTEIAVASIGHSKLLHFLFPDTIGVDLGFNEAGILAAQTLLTLLNKPLLASNNIVPCRLAVA